MSSEQVSKDGMMSVDDAVAFLKISRSRLYGLVRSGELLSCKFGRCRRIPRAAAEDLIRRSLVPA